MSVRSTFVEELHNTSTVILLIENQLLVEEKHKNPQFSYFTQVKYKKKSILRPSIQWGL